MAPSSSEDATRAMRREPKRLPRNYLRRNGGNAILYILISFHSRDVRFRLFCARLAVYSVLGS